VLGKKQRFDPKTVTGCKQSSSIGVPQTKGKFSAQEPQAVEAHFSIEMKHELAVRLGENFVSPSPQELQVTIMLVKLTVGDQREATIGGMERLVTAFKIDH
jgi:hypothetical protein